MDVRSVPIQLDAMYYTVQTINGSAPPQSFDFYDPSQVPPQTITLPADPLPPGPAHLTTVPRLFGVGSEGNESPVLAETYVFDTHLPTVTGSPRGRVDTQSFTVATEPSASDGEGDGGGGGPGLGDGGDSGGGFCFLSVLGLSM